jgi:hypothetical protein
MVLRTPSHDTLCAGGRRSFPLPPCDVSRVSTATLHTALSAPLSPPSRCRLCSHAATGTLLCTQVPSPAPSFVHFTVNVISGDADLYVLHYDPAK